MTGPAQATRGQSAVTRIPYLGLAAFADSDEDAELFFGRSEERDIVIANLQSARVTVLYGKSGVGKSSLLHAGVAHHLRTEHASPVVMLDDWSSDPTAALAGAVRAAVSGGSAPLDPSQSLAEAIDELRSRRAPALLVILDRFEDYLRLHPTASAEGFGDTLAALLAPRELLVRVLITVRDDRLADLDRLDGLVPGLFENVLRLDPMTRDAAMEAIVGPLERYNARLRAAGADGEVTLESGLAEQVLDELSELGETEDERAAGRDPELRRATPIEPVFLSLTMRRLWDADIGTGGQTLRRSTLASLGGAARIFAGHLEIIMNALSSGEQRLATDVLRFLVTPSGVTQRYSAGDLADYVGSNEAVVEALAEKLSGEPARVLHAVDASAGGVIRVEYELAHQVLVRPALEWQSRYRTKHLERRSRRLLLALVAVSAIALALAGYVVGPAPLSRLELSTVDARFSVRGAQPPDRDIVMVPIDAATLTRLMQTSVRAGMARVLDRITAAGPRAIACDIIFTGPSPTQSQGDRALMSAVRRDGARLVLATDSLVEAGTTELFGSSSETFTDLSHPAAGWAGFPGNPLDPHAVVREMERDISASASQAGPESTGPMSMATLAVETVRRADLAPHGALPATAWIDFRGGAGTFPSVPFDDVLSGQPAALSQLRNRIVVLGVTAPAAHDSAHDTSAPGRSVMTGTELQANAISTAQRGFPLRDAGLGVDVALIVGLGLVPFALALRFGARLSAAGALAAAVLFCIGAQLTFDSGRVVNVVFPLVSLVVSSAGVLAVLLMGRRPAHAETPVTASSR